ncbi:hypothetical protein L1987_42548 [Smallanthus sonchifolius]|uniref:Uncharacterized protein n=1 Tax=Smallanthus sonchifolius TaxID=185202 RepID=A0ACB9GJ29_9ASTR|nr:hypothetical protein L1987_42548 [Smallanthus sonchifolius]
MSRPDVFRRRLGCDIKTYDGTNDPEDHLQVFSGAAGVERWTNAECCHMFMQTLIGSARLWFTSLPERSIDSFDDLSQRFLANFTQLKMYTKDAAVLYQIKQKEDEGLRSFIERYKKEGLSYGKGSDTKSGIQETRSLEEPPLFWLEAKVSLLRRKEVNRHHDSRKTEDRYRPPYLKNTPEKEKYIAFTALSKKLEQIPPRPLAKSSEGRSSSKYCEFHDDRGHHTNDCYQLKKRIEEAVKSGELAHLVKDIKKKNDPRGKEKGKEMNIIHLIRSETQKRPRRESWDK